MPRVAVCIGTLLFAAFAAAQVSHAGCPAGAVEFHAIHFADSFAVSDALQRDVATRLHSYRCQADYENEVPEIVRDVFQQHGYFRAKVEKPRFDVLSTSPKQVILDATFAAEPGPQYRLRSIEFSGARAFNPEQVRPVFPIADGDVFNVEKARVGIRALKYLYLSKGYVDFTPIPDFTFDATAPLLTMKIVVDEGYAYRVGDLIVTGEESEPGAKERLLKAWEKYKGTYRGDAMEQVLRDLHARPNLPMDEFVEVSLDNKNHVLTYRLSLGKPGRRLSFAP